MPRPATVRALLSPSPILYLGANYRGTRGSGRAYEAAKLHGTRVAREVAKVCGFYAADRKVVAVELSPKSRSTIAQFEAMTDDQLIAIIEAPEVESP